MKVLIIGNGGREHALAWKAAQSPTVDEVFVAPGNAGTHGEPMLTNIDIGITDISALVDFVKQNNVALTIVGPEAPLVEGIVDTFKQHNLAIFGPTQGAAQLEGSKAFTKDFLARHNIPTAAYENFTEIEPAVAYVKKQGTPIVIKADGLAAGKGVIIAQTEQEAIAAIEDMLAGNRFGEAGHRVVVEEFLTGEEASFIVMADGKNILPLATSQDHKARDNGDKGPNTGGMGAYSPAPVVTDKIAEKVMQTIIEPTIKGMAAEGNEYSGFLYAGLMISPDGDLKVLEYNCRFGDPETQPIMMRLQSDLVELCQAAIEHRLDSISARWDSRASICIIMAAGGYPDSYDKGHIIEGLGLVDSDTTKVFHAGTTIDNDQVVTSGGRVLCMAALGNSVSEAQALAYEKVKKIHWQDTFYRTDIGYRAIARESSDKS